MSFKALDALGERHDQIGQLADQASGPDRFRGPWLNTDDAAAYLRYTGKHPLLSVYKFITRHAIVVRRDGRRLLIARADIDRALAVGRKR